MKKPFFILVASSTELSNKEGVSAAGADSEAQKLTPSLDAEFLTLGQTKSAEALPVSPEGVISPALISKACLNMLDAEIRVINVGAFNKFQGIDAKQMIDLALDPAKDFSEENSFSFDECEAIFVESIKLLDKLSFDEKEHELIIAECVVGGTTTALALLELLGYSAQDYISSSYKGNNNKVKNQLIKKLNSRLKNFDFDSLENPLYNCALAGDKAQVLISGLTLSAMQNGVKTILAGGTQMLAIYALLQDLTEGFFLDDLIEVSTSPWLINDESSDAQALALDINEELHLTYLEDFAGLEDLLRDEIAKLSQGQYPSWDEIKTLYDKGYVKEGLGMGALLKLCSNKLALKN